MAFGPAVKVAPGTTLPSALRTAPTGWLLCDGSTVSRTTYANLFNAICTSVGTPTISNASPAVVSLTSHGLSQGDQVRFSTTGSLPTGITAGTDYYIISAGFGANSFEISASPGGTAINTSSAGSGTHTLWYAPHGLGDLSTTFHLPNMSGYWVNGHSTTYPQGYSNSAPTHTHGVSTLTLSSHTHSVPNMTVPSLTLNAHSHTLSGNGYLLYAFPGTSTGFIKLNGVSGWTDTTILSNDNTSSITADSTSRTSGIAIDGATDTSGGGSWSTASSATTGTWTSGAATGSNNVVGGTLDNNSTNTLPPHLGVKYMIKT